MRQKKAEQRKTSKGQREICRGLGVSCMSRYLYSSESNCCFSTLTCCLISFTYELLKALIWSIIVGAMIVSKSLFIIYSLRRL